MMNAGACLVLETALFGFEGVDKATRKRPVGQAVKTAASHAANVGSIPARVTSFLECFP